MSTEHRGSVASLTTTGSSDRSIELRAPKRILRGTILRGVAAAATTIIVIAQIPTILEAAGIPNWNGYGVRDYELYMEATRRWLAGGAFYQPWQLAGPYQITHGAVLYPPVALALFAPFTILPSLLWWAVPLGLTVWAIGRLNPGPLAWPLIALAFWEPVQIHIISGNPGLWSMAAIAVGTQTRWASPLAFLKPSIGFFGVFGIGTRQWWYGLGAFALLSLAFLPLWPDWLAAITNSTGAGVFYSWQEWPMMAAPIVAWACRPGGRYDIERRRVR